MTSSLLSADLPLMVKAQTKLQWEEILRCWTFYRRLGDTKAFVAIMSTSQHHLTFFLNNNKKKEFRVEHGNVQTRLNGLIIGGKSLMLATADKPRSLLKNEKDNSFRIINHFLCLSLLLIFFSCPRLS